MGEVKEECTFWQGAAESLNDDLPGLWVVDQRACNPLRATPKTEYDARDDEQAKVACVTRPAVRDSRCGSVRYEVREAAHRS